MFKTKTTIRLQDTDAAGVIFFTSLLNIAHHNYEQWLDTINLPIKKIIYSKEFLIVIAHAEVDYYQPITVNDEITTTITSQNIANSSFILLYDFTDNQGQHIGKATTKHVVVDHKTKKAIPIPNHLRKALETLSPLHNNAL